MRNVRPVSVGNCILDGKHIYIQSMLNIPADDIDGNVRQAAELEKCGCEILRVAIPDEKAVRLIPAIKEKISIPLVADIHFDYRLALLSAEAGIDKIRINPGNIGALENVKAVADICSEKKIPIRIGVNSGSLDKSLLKKYGKPTAEALAESAWQHIRLLEKFNFHDIVVSIKSSDVKSMISAYRIMADECDYPLHLGVTEAGTERMGLIKSSIGIGALLSDEIGETIRVSLTDNPVREIKAARDILKALNLRSGVQFISCPTCGRTKIDLVRIAHEVENRFSDIDKDIKIAVMGRVVNGPGEAREADIGIAGGDGCAVLFKKGEILYKVPENEILSALEKEIEKL